MAKPNPVKQKLSNSGREMNSVVDRLDQLTGRVDEITATVNQVTGILSDLSGRMNVLENRNVPQSGNIQNVPVSFIFSFTDSFS